MKMNIFCVLILYIINGCSTTYQLQNNDLIQTLEKNKNEIAVNAKSMEGQEKSVLLRAWGAPKSIANDGKSGKIYHYSNDINLSAGKYTILINMFINKEGKVYASDVKHLLQ